MHRTLKVAAAFLMTAGIAHADAFTDSIVTNLTDLGYGFIEIQDGLTQTKVEAIRGTEKLEVIYDRATGRILKQERERADADEVGKSGIQVRNRNRDFVEASLVAAGDAEFNQRIVGRLQADGYDFIEIKTGIAQVKVEAIRGTEKLELILDRATGDVLKREIERARTDEIGRSGIEIDSRNRDFLGGGDRRSGRGDDDSSGSVSGSNSGSGSSGGSEESGDDNSGSGSGSGSRSGSNSGKG